MRSTAFVTLALATTALAATAQDGANPAVQALQQFVNRNGVTRMEGRVDVENQFAITAVRGCRISITRDTDTGVLARIQSTIEMDLSAMSPDVDLQPAGDGTGVTRVHVMTSSGEEIIRGESKVTVLGRERRNTDTYWELPVLFRSSIAPEGARVFAEAIQACGGQVHTAEVKASTAARRLREAGNDPETFPLKGQCRDMVAGLVRENAAFPSDSTFNVLRHSDQRRVEISGELREDGVLRSFRCKFRQSDSTWVPDGRPTVTDRDD